MPDLKKTISSAVKSKEVAIGFNSTMEAINRGTASKVVVSNNCPARMRERLTKRAEMKNIPVEIFPGSSRELSAVCKKPFNIAVLSVVGKA